MNLNFPDENDPVHVKPLGTFLIGRISVALSAFHPLGVASPIRYNVFVMGLCVYLVSCFISNIYAELVLEIIVGVVVYVAISLISKNETFCLLTGVLKDKLHIHKN